MNKTLSIVITGILAIVLVFVFMQSGKIPVADASNVSIKDGVQYVTVNVRG